MTEVLIKYINAFFLFFILVQVDFTSGEDHAARIRFPNEVSGPDIKRNDFLCGYKYICGVYYASVEQTGEHVHMYYLNKTAKRLQREGFNVTVMEMNGDAIANMSFTNGTFSDVLSYNHYFAVAPAGGEPAEKERAQYMAQLGSWIGDKIAFLCDGVLINRKWVLTAAHCFTDFIEPNLVRLGDYDITVPPKSDDDPAVHGKRIEDYPIGDVIFHPEYNPDERYHDLALIPLPQKTPNYSPSINPACLPWDSGTSEDLIGQEVVLTGWGATMYGKRKTPLLQQVKLKVFDSQTCNQTYSDLPNFFRKHPQGLDNENILCVGWEEDGKDACDGDSGAPIVSDKGRGFTVVGIVSGGYGCGLKEYPGLYIPINKPKYLNWIKEVAFSDYN